MAIPTLTPEQRAEALARAIELRTRRAEVKEQIKAGQVSVETALTIAQTDVIVGGIRVVTFLESLPGVGKIKAAALMESIGIAPTRRLRGLGQHQRSALIAHFGGK